MAEAATGALYPGAVMHRRFGSGGYRFRQGLFCMVVDLDRLRETATGLRLFSYNRFNVFSIHDRDHGPKDGSPLRPWIDAVLQRAGLALDGGRVLLQCMPRVLGHAFNPLSLWYCYHRDGELRAVLCEVRNTFGDWHGYLLHDGGRPLEIPVRSHKRKVFHVSPFFPVAGEYRFRIQPPGDDLTTSIRYLDNGECQLTAVQTGHRRPLTDAGLAAMLLRHRLLGLRVVAGIHWQALKIWLRGGRLHRRPAPPDEEVS